MSEQERQNTFVDPSNLVLVALLLVFVFMSVLPIFRARKWLDDHQKWFEISEMEWFEPKPQSIMVPILMGVIPLTLVCLWIWFA